MTEKELEKELTRKLEQERCEQQILELKRQQKEIKFAIAGIWLIVLSVILTCIFA